MGFYAYLLLCCFWPEWKTDDKKVCYLLTSASVFTLGAFFTYVVLQEAAYNALTPDKPKPDADKPDDAILTVRAGSATMCAMIVLALREAMCKFKTKQRTE